MARGRRPLDFDRIVTLGGSVPRSVGGLLVAMLVFTVAGMISTPLWTWLCLDGPSLYSGQLWRAVTWVLPQGHPLTLLFTGFVVHWLGRDLVSERGERGFLALYFGYAAWAAFCTGLVAAMWAGAERYHAGAWAVLNGLLVGWGLSRRGAQLNLFGVVPLSGEVLAWLITGGTVLFALADRGGVGEYVPHLAALIPPWLAQGGITPRRLWLRGKQRWYDAQLKRRKGHLRPVPRDDDKPKWMN